MTLDVYGLTRCSTCRKARAWLDRRGIAHEFVDYRDHPIGAEELKAWADMLGGWEELVNRSSMTWRNLPEDVKNPEGDGEWLALIAEFPALVRRPVIWDGESVSVGFDASRFQARYAP